MNYFLFIPALVLLVSLAVNLVLCNSELILFQPYFFHCHYSSYLEAHYSVNFLFLFLLGPSDGYPDNLDCSIVRMMFGLGMISGPLPMDGLIFTATHPSAEHCFLELFVYPFCLLSKAFCHIMVSKPV